MSASSFAPRGGGGGAVSGLCCGTPLALTDASGSFAPNAPLEYVPSSICLNILFQNCLYDVYLEVRVEYLNFKDVLVVDWLLYLRMMRSISSLKVVGSLFKIFAKYCS